MRYLVSAFVAKLPDQCFCGKATWPAYMPDPLGGGKYLMVFSPIFWPQDADLTDFEKIIFFISGTVSSFGDFAAENKPVLWEGMIWVAWHVSKLTPSQVSFC